MIIFEMLLEPAVWLSFATLCLLEIILGIDNLIFIAIVADRVPKAKRAKARRVGLSLALIMRVLLLLSITWVISLTEPLFVVFDIGYSWRDIILFSGGLFLIAKATLEIYDSVEHDTPQHTDTRRKALGFVSAIVQIILLDLVFSFDSILTAVGLTDRIPIMIAAICVAIGVMLWASEPVSEFVRRHLSIKLLALAFLVLIGAVLIADGLHFHIPKGYIYFSVAFSLSVQALAMLARARGRGAV